MEVNLCNSSYSSQSFTPILKCDFLSDLLQTCVNPILWNRLGLPPQSSASGNAELAPLAFAQLRARIFLFAPRWARGGRKLSVSSFISLVLHLMQHCCRTRDIRRDVVKKNKSLEKKFQNLICILLKLLQLNYI